MADNFPIQVISVHCSDSPDDKNFDVTDVDRWHKAQGWSKVGYHYVITRKSEIQRGREDGEIPSAVYGHNRHSIAICWMGSHKPEPGQYLTLVYAIACIARKHRLEAKHVRGHKEFPNVTKSCPNLDMDQLRADVAQRLAETDPALVGGGSCSTGALCNCAVGSEKKR
jgi:N-acetylmuramoyl-L-alanine amidase